MTMTETSTEPIYYAETSDLAGVFYFFTEEQRSNWLLSTPNGHSVPAHRISPEVQAEAEAKRPTARVIAINLEEVKHNGPGFEVTVYREDRTTLTAWLWLPQDQGTDDSLSRRTIFAIAWDGATEKSHYAEADTLRGALGELGCYSDRKLASQLQRTFRGAYFDS